MRSPEPGEAMKKRSRASGEPVKMRRRKTKAVRRGSSSAAGQETRVARLARDLNEALQQQNAAADVLKVISRSTFDLQTVLVTLLASAARLCESEMASISQRDGDVYRIAASFGYPTEYGKFLEEHPITPDRGTVTGRAVLEARVAHITDITRDPEYTRTEAATLGSAPTKLGVPLLREGSPIGVMVLSRKRVEAFTERQIEVVKTFADQAVIAIENARLLNELRQRTTDLTERTADLTEALEQQTATSEVLQVISSSPGDLEPVFAAMLENAVRICEAKFGNIYRAEGGGLRNVATHNTPPAFAEALRSSPYLSPGPRNPVRRMINTKTIVHVVDVGATEAYAEREPIAVASVELGGTRTLMIVPMLKDNELVGAFTLARQEVRPFTDRQIELVKNFAAQAVIAIENARLLNELRQSLEQQTATANVLEVISRSAFDLHAVFKTVAESSVRLCGADRAFIFRFDGEMLRMAVAFNSSLEFEEWVARTCNSTGAAQRLCPRRARTPNDPHSRCVSRSGVCLRGERCRTNQDSARGANTKRQRPVGRYDDLPP